MPYVLLIFGASGSGKSTLMEELGRVPGRFSIHKKGTDRKPRIYDGVEIEYVPTVAKDRYDYIYETYGYRYGIQRSQIDVALRERRHHFIICNDITVIKDIKTDYGDVVRVLFHHFDAPRQALLELQKLRGISDDEINLRLAKTEVLYRTFVEEHELFNGVILNHYQAPPSTMLTQVDTLLLRFEQARPLNVAPEIIEEIKRAVEVLQSDRTLIPARPEPVEPGYVFVVMAMDRVNAALADAHSAIVRGCAAAGMRAGRVDDKFFTGSVTDQIQANITLAQYVVADLTHARPNVYYEVGYAHALQKRILLVAKQKTKIHFDLQHHRIMHYPNLTELESSLTTWLRGLQGTS